jgi:dTDP-4-amino-4,6-dideoxygalactose transaminase
MPNYFSGLGGTGWNDSDYKRQKIKTVRSPPMKRKLLSFSPPDITRKEINYVIAALKSGWITTGPKTALFEQRIKQYCSVEQAVALSSATAGMELILKVFRIAGDAEVITTPYTFAATANIILHRGIKPTFVDVKKDSFLIDEQRLYDAIKSNTRAIITVDFAGVPVDYNAIKEVIKVKKRDDIILISDSAHSFGARYQGKRVGDQLHFHVFSFHAVKNLATAEGGAITFADNHPFGKEDLARELKITALHGQSKDAFAKMKAGGWKYDILTDGFKCNMPDTLAAIGLGQLERYDGMVEKRKRVFNLYSEVLSAKEWAILPFQTEKGTETSYHLYPLRIRGFSETQRDRVIQQMAESGIATNVHFIPLPMFSLYKSLGYSIRDYPNAYQQYANEITLPLYSKLSLKEARYVVTQLIKCVEAER